MFWRTKQVTVTPRFLIVNCLDEDIYLRQAETDSPPLLLKAKGRTPFYWVRLSTHPPTHPPTQDVQHLIRTASFSSTFSTTHPPTHPPTQSSKNARKEMQLMIKGQTGWSYGGVKIDGVGSTAVLLPQDNDPTR